MRPLHGSTVVYYEIVDRVQEKNEKQTAYKTTLTRTRQCKYNRQI